MHGSRLPAYRPDIRESSPSASDRTGTVYDHRTFPWGIIRIPCFPATTSSSTGTCMSLQVRSRGRWVEQGGAPCNKKILPGAMALIW